MTLRPRVAIAWFRRDLRLGDNRMLAAATAADRVHPVFVADPRILAENAAATARVAWFGANLGALDAALRAAGSGLTVLHGDPEHALRSFAADVGAEVVFAARDEDPPAVARDERVGRRVDLRLVDDQRLLAPGELRTVVGEPYRVFSPFRRALGAWLAEAGPEAVAPAEPRLARLVRSVAAAGRTPFPAPAPSPALPPAGEAAAAERLAAFVERDLRRYAARRDRPDLDSTSRLSPYLRTGALSIRAAWRVATAAEREAAERGDAELAASARRWLDELAWREFFASILDRRPQAAVSAPRAQYADIEWEEGIDAEAALQAWREGRTGYPIVDAGMRQLRTTGWMHNRLRLITASFLVKDLGIDWRRGEAAFMEHLLDGDLAQNNGNWRWVAGVGTDAAPYFRIFNPVAQGRRFDPDGSFVRRWVPELEKVPIADLHAPWRAPEGARPRAYPAPIVDHAAARSRTLARYSAARRLASSSPRR